MSAVAKKEKKAIRKQEKKEAKAVSKQHRLERRANIREEIASGVVSSLEQAGGLNPDNHGSNVVHVIAGLQQYEDLR